MEWLRSIDMDAKTLALLERGESRYDKLRVNERLEQFEKAMGEWAAVRVAHINGGEEVRKVKEAKQALLAFTYWPNVCDPQHAATLFKFMNWIFLFDDVVDNSCGLRRNAHEVAHLASKLIHAIFCHPLDHYKQSISSPKELLVVEVGIEWWEEIKRDPRVSATQLVHFETTISEYMLSQAPFTRLNELMDANKPPSVEEYMPLRRLSSGMLICFLGTEYELAIELENETLNHPLVKKLREAISNYCCGLNDWYSFPKELQKGDFVSLLPLLHIQNNKLAQQAGQPLVPFHVAVSQAWEMINTHERECVQLASLILKSPILASNPRIKEYVEALCGYNPATWAWTSRNQRYSYTPRASCTPPSFPHAHTRICAHEVATNSQASNLVRSSNPHYLQLKNLNKSQGRRFSGTLFLAKKDTSFALMPKHSFKSVPSSVMTFGG